MSLWVVRAGRHGEQEEIAVKNQLVCHAWNELPDYSTHTKDDLRKLYREKYPSESEKQVISGLGQVWRFAHEIQKGDLVALPLKSQSAFEFGRITGDYQYKEVAPNVKHIRCVEWLKNATVRRSAFPEDILFSMNSALTVFKVYRNDAENRVNKILVAPLVFELAVEDVESDIGSVADDEAVDLKAIAGDEILKFIEANFKGHTLLTSSLLC
jgi:restriction system protein